MDIELKKGISVQLDDTITTLQLRLQLNQQAMDTQNDGDTYVEDGLDFIHAITNRKHDDKKVIEDCKMNIAKLKLLKMYFSILTVDKAAQLFNNHEKISYEHFQQQLIMQENC